MKKLIPKEEYYAQLPKKRIGAAALFFNKDKKILILKTSYSEKWTMPGGVIEENESPMEGCKREIVEEIGIKIDSYMDLLLVSYSNYKNDKSRMYMGEGLQFMFYAGVIEESDVRIDNDEIIDYAFVYLNEAEEKLGIKLYERLRTVIENEDIKYIEFEDNINICKRLF